MDSGPSSDSKDTNQAQPAPESLSERSEAVAAGGSQDSLETKQAKPGRSTTYRPSHRATFVGLAVVALVLAINAVIFAVIIKNQSKNTTDIPQGQVSVSQSVLDKLGVNQGTVGDSGVVLTITPNTKFGNNVIVGGNISVGGQFNLNSKLTASDASFTQLEAGKVALNDLTVSGTATLADAVVQKSITISGATQLQGAVTVSQLFTINNSANIAGNVSVGGTVSAATVTARTLVTTSTLTVSGHVITVGPQPSLSSGVGLGSNGTISMSGNDAAGTIAANVGVGMSSGGIIATVTFRTPYATTPHVVVTPIGDIGTDFYISRNSTGFSIGVHGPITNPGGYAFDYIVEQ